MPAVRPALAELRARIGEIDGTGSRQHGVLPFGVQELLSRVRVALRHATLPASQRPVFESDGLRVDLEHRQVFREGHEVHLTPTEYKLLYHLVRNAGHVLTRATLLAKVWGREYVDEVDYLRVYIRRLREKLGDEPDHPRYIRTERGLGYRFIADELEAGGHRASARFPSLRGQPAEYLRRQLELFHADRRGGGPSAHLMQPIAARLTADEIEVLSRYFAALPPEPAAPRP